MEIIDGKREESGKKGKVEKKYGWRKANGGDRNI